ncbi:uncharacterized protein LOC118756197, partial [Rhagoletis pomonella]|uniref:uncharacterized protein LOC118756197 n=1 Tax=Rhagoletis pomonella TaxID=28610 RepID=UPI00177C1547
MIVRSVSSYTDTEKTLAQNINYMSTKAYNFMRDDLKFSLPHKKSLLRWRPIKYVSPGIDFKVIENLKYVVSEMSPTERFCEILFDEISIKKDLVYNKSRDIIDGFVDIGDGNRDLNVADKCCFFMVKAIAADWKYVLSYYMVKGGMSASNLLESLTENIKTVEGLGLSVKAIVCDQGPTNVRLFKLLNVSAENPFFIFNSNKIHCLYDYCHLIKSVRNNLLKHDLKTVDGIASGKVIRQLYSVDKANVNFKVCPKLTASHIYPNNFEKMSVSRATQLLSNSVAAGIDMAQKQGLLGSDEYTLKCAKPTQLFVKRMNDLFDELDCKRLNNKNPLKGPIWRDSVDKLNRLKDHIKFISSIQLPNNINSSCFAGFILTINSMINLSQDVFENCKDLNFILLGKLNQDALENFFYRIRATQGINTHPSGHEIQYIVARLISMKILRRKFDKKGTNCEDDEDLNLDWNIADEDSLKDNLGPSEQLAMDVDIPEEQFSWDIDIPEEHFALAEGASAEIQVQ